MSIQFDNRIHKISEKEFYKIDYHVMGLAYEIQNDFGRLLNEKIYQQELANRCYNFGFRNVEIEVPISVSHENFTKKYYVDLIIENSIVYELKTAKSLTSDHEKQIINYLLLLELHHGQLINFKPQSVQKRFISTTIDKIDRYKILINIDQWLDLDSDTIWFKELMIQLIQDWGAFLELNLFYDAISFFHGGADKVIKNIDVIYNGLKLGEQKMHLLNSKTAFKITARIRDLDSYEKHLIKILNLVDLDAIQWVNFNKKNITFKTIRNIRAE